MSSETTDVFDILSDRHEILALIADGACSQQQITEQTSTSQSTISRALTRFKDLGLVRETNSQYELTLLGNLVHQKFEACVRNVEQLYTAEDILNDLPADVPFNPAVLTDADVTISQPHAPDAALDPVLRLTQEATYIKAVAAIVYAGYADTFSERMVDSDLDAEFVMTEAVIDQSRKVYENRDPTAVCTGRLDLYVTEEDIPYSLMLVKTEDDVYTVIVVSSNSGTHGTITTSNSTACEWTRNQYEKIKAAAEPWEPSTS